MMLKANVEYHIIELNHPAPPEVLTWVRGSFGDGRDGRWKYMLNTFYFANRSDHLMFTLKWS
jgi:hypothetical protein